MHKCYKLKKFSLNKGACVHYESLVAYKKFLTRKSVSKFFCKIGSKLTHMSQDLTLARYIENPPDSVSNRTKSCSDFVVTCHPYFILYEKKENDRESFDTIL